MSAQDVLRENKWCLDPLVLARLVFDAKATSNAVQTYQISQNHRLLSLPMRSEIAESVFYEVLVEEKGTKQRTFINLWREEDGEKQYCCIYDDGRILRWGSWALELVTALPHLVSTYARKRADPELLNLMRDAGREASPSVSLVAWAETAFVLEGDALSEEDQKDVVRQSNNGKPIDAL